MHCYLVGRCKTVGCKGKLYLAHVEVPGEPSIVLNWPDTRFPVSVKCGICAQTQSFTDREVQTESSRDPHHPPDWKPVLGPPESPDIH